MEHELIKKSSEIFNSHEKWKSFLELAELKDKITNQWYLKLRDEVIQNIKLNSMWEFEGNEQYLHWYLKDFGKDSLSIWLERRDFSLYATNDFFNNAIISENLNNNAIYKPISEAIKYKDAISSGPYFIQEKGKFQFGCIYDNNFYPYNLAWFAGNETGKYIEQINLKIQPFMSEEITNLLIKLNELSKVEKQL